MALPHRNEGQHLFDHLDVQEGGSFYDACEDCVVSNDHSDSRTCHPGPRWLDMPEDPEKYLVYVMR